MKNKHTTLIATVILLTIAIIFILSTTASAAMETKPFEILFKQEKPADPGPDLIYMVNEQNYCVKDGDILHCGCLCTIEQEISYNKSPFILLFTQDKPEEPGPDVVYTIESLGWTCVRDGSAFSCTCTNCSLCNAPPIINPTGSEGTETTVSKTPVPPPTTTKNPPPPTTTVEPSKTPKPGCNQGIGNGTEGCDPGNSNNHNPSNDESGNHGRGGDKNHGGGKKN